MTNLNEYPLNEAGKDNKTFLVIKEKDNTEEQNGFKIFICLPKNFCVYKKEEFEADLVNQTKAALERYYEPFNVEIHYTTKPNTAEIYVMDNTTHRGYDNEIKIKITNIINEMLGKEYAVKIKLHYAAFDPNFTPVSSDDDIIGRSFVPNAEYNYEIRSMHYHAEMPTYSFEQVVLPDATKNEIEKAIGILEAEKKVFDEWGLRAIIPYASSAIGFYGPPRYRQNNDGRGNSSKIGVYDHKCYICRHCK